MKHIFIFSALIFGILSAYAADNRCSAWSKTNGVTCVFNGEDATAWTRTCTDSEYACKNPDYYRTPCDAEKICVDSKINPNLLTTVCTNWVLDDSVTCVDENSNDAKVWRRACQMAWVTTAACQNVAPEND